jgi:hypothetical protein
VAGNTPVVAEDDVDALELDLLASSRMAYRRASERDEPRRCLREKAARTVVCAVTVAKSLVR